MAKTVFLLRTWLLVDPKKARWIVFDEYADQKASAGSKKKAIEKYRAQFGDFDKIVRYEGESSPSCAAMTVADHMMKKPKPGMQ